MRKHALPGPVLVVLMLILSASCNGQEKTKSPAANKNGTVSVSRPGMIRTHNPGHFANVHDGLQDKAGNLWFCTTGAGVYRYDGASFTNFTVRDGLGSDVVYTALEDKAGNIWFGTATGICRYDGKSFRQVPVMAGQGSGFAPFGAADSTVAGNMVSAVLEDKSGKIWIGTASGVYRYNGKSFTAFYDDPVVRKSGFHLNVVQSMIEDRAGHIWFASWEREGAICYNGASITGYKPNGDDMVYSMLEDRSGNIWFGTRNHGACRYDPLTGSFTGFDTVGGFGSCSVYAIAQDAAGTIWFGTEAGDMARRATAGGVWRYTPALSGETGIFTNFTTKDGLSDNAVFSITIDRSGTLWFGTRGTGLCSYDGKRFVAY